MHIYRFLKYMDHYEYFRIAKYIFILLLLDYIPIHFIWIYLKSYL